jgi:hypothetical protein
LILCHVVGCFSIAHKWQSNDILKRLSCAPYIIELSYKKTQLLHDNICIPYEYQFHVKVHYH